MWMVDEFEEPLGPGQSPRRLKEKAGPFGSRGEAEDYLNKLIGDCDFGERDFRQDCWWCRNDGDDRNLLYVIRQV